MALDGLMFDHVRSFPLAVTVVCVRAKASVRPCIPYNVIMFVVVEGNVFEFIVRRRTNNGVVLYELIQNWFEFVAMYNTQIPHENVMKKVRWEGIKLCAILGGTRTFIQENGII